MQIIKEPEAEWTLVKYKTARGRRQGVQRVKAEDEMVLPLETRSDSRDSRRWVGAPVRSLWT